LILLGSKTRLAIDTARAANAARDPALAHNLQRSGIGDLDDVLGSVVQTDAELRREARGITPVTDDIPSIQYPYENVRVDTTYTTSLPLTAAHAFVLLGPEADTAVRARVAGAWRATAAAISVLPLLRPSVPAEWAELEMGRAMLPALHARPNNSGLWDVLGLDPDHMRAAEAAVRNGSGSQRTAAGWTVARRAFYAADYARALDELKSIHPEPDEIAQYALLRGGCLRALGDASEAEAAFRQAAEASHDERFKSAALTLATTATASFEAERGPWSIESLPR
jgi:tetratricopeptide (TPR) repeat protein